MGKTENEEKPTTSRKRARYWESAESMLLVEKWGEEQIQLELKSCKKKKPIWEKMSRHLNGEGYVDRNGEQCQVRIKTLLSSYRAHKDSKNNNTGDEKKNPPCCYQELDILMSDKPTTFPRHVINSSDHQIMNSSDINLSDIKFSAFNSSNSSASNTSSSSVILSSGYEHSYNSGSEDENLLDEEGKNNEESQQSFHQTEDDRPTEIKRFDFLKKPRQKKKNVDIFFDHFNNTVEKFMEEQKKSDEEFLKVLKNMNEDSVDSGEFILKIRERGEDSFMECELQEKSMESLLNLIKEEFDEGNIAALWKLPNVLIRNDKDVYRLKNNTEIEFITHNNVIIRSGHVTHD